MQMAFLFTQKYKRVLGFSLVVVMCCVGMLSGYASAADAGTVKISEFIANPGVVSDANGEWIEIQNNSPQTVNLTNWDIDGSTIVSVGNAVYLRPGQSAVICKNAVRTQNDGVICDATSSFSLGNTSDTINLRNETNAVIDAVTYTESHVVEGKSTHVPAMTPEVTKKYSANNFGRPAHNQTTPPEPLGEIRVHHVIDANKNTWPDFTNGEPHYKGRTVRLYVTNGNTWSLKDSVVTTGKYYAESAKFIVEPSSYALCEVAEPGFTQSFGRTIVGWYHAPLNTVANLSGDVNEYSTCIPVNVSAGVLSSHVFGDYAAATNQ